MGVKDLDVISGQDFFVMTNVAKLQSIIKQLFETFWDLIFHHADAQHALQIDLSWAVVAKKSSGSAQLFVMNFLTSLVGLWVACRGCYCKRLHPREIIVVGKRGWDLFIVHFQRQPQLQGMDVVYLPALGLGRLERYWWNGWSTLFFGYQAYQLQGQRNNLSDASDGH